jgi:ELWxxDGT repeat protein
VSIIFFDHYDPATGEELWLNSGGITKLVKDINPGLGWSNPENLTPAGGTLFFTAYDNTNGYQLWKTDGTAAGTVRLTSFAPSSQDQFCGFVNANDTLFFEANDGTHGLQLWKSDGTVAGTMMLTDAQGGFTARPVLAFNSNYFFTAWNGGNLGQLWKSDGTPGGTVPVTNESGGLVVESYVAQTSPHVPSDSPAVIGNDFYFVALDNNGYQICKSDGTPSGTTMVTNVNGNTNPYGMYAAWPTNVNGTLFFSANDGNGPEIWKSDGTPGGTVMVANLISGSGTTYVDPYYLTAVNNELFFVATDAVHGTQLWKSDGTGAGTVQVTDIGSPPGNFQLQDLTSFNGELYFFANDGFDGWQLWKSDGTAAGTVMVTDVSSLSPVGTTTADGFPIYSFEPNIVGGTLYFETSDHQLWKSDGTGAGTVMVASNVDTTQPIGSLAGQLIQPTVTSVAASPQTGAFGVGQEIGLTVGFSEGVTVSGTPTLLLNDGATASYDPAATAALKDPTKTVFDYTVGAGQNTAALVVTGSLNGGNIVDSAGNPADLSSLPTVFNGLLIDTAPPTLAITSEVLTGDDGQLTLTGTISDNIDTPTITIFDGTTSLGTATINGTNWTFATTLSQGTHQLSAKAVDQAGNTATVNAPQSVTVNDVATAPTLSGPSSVTWTKGAASVTLPISVAGGDADDLATTTLTIKGLKNGATITDKLDSTVFSSSTVTLTAAEVNSGLSLHPGGLTSGTLTVTASMTEGGGSATSAPLTISLPDPPAHHQTLGSRIEHHAAQLDLIDQLHGVKPDLLLYDPHGHDGSNTLALWSPKIQDVPLLETAIHGMASLQANPAGMIPPVMDNHQTNPSDYPAFGSSGHHGG